MRWMTFMLGLVLVPLGLLAQPSVQPVSAKSELAPLSDHDRNIEAYIRLMRADLRKEKAQVTGLVMALDADDAAKFWPVYKDFEADLAQVYDGVLALVKNYADNYDKMSEPVADQLAIKLLDLEQRRDELKRAYYQKFKAALDPITALRFLQVENQIERVLDLQIASELPIARSEQ